jgi:hypothetical protein
MTYLQLGLGLTLFKSAVAMLRKKYNIAFIYIHTHKYTYMIYLQLGLGLTLFKSAVAMLRNKYNIASIYIHTHTYTCMIFLQLGLGLTLFKSAVAMLPKKDMWAYDSWVQWDGILLAAGAMAFSIVSVRSTR